MSFDELVAAVRSEAGVDQTATVVGGWVNQRYKTMVARARWLMAEVAVGTTVADQAVYPLGDDIVDVEGLMVGSQPYEPKGAQTMWAVKYGTARVTPGYGIFAPSYGGSGGRSIELYPVPDSSGVAITALASIQPPDLSGSMEPDIPVDLHEGLRDGAISTGLRLEDERIPEADSFEGRFVDATNALARRKNSRLNHGPTQILIKNIHW